MDVTSALPKGETSDSSGGTSVHCEHAARCGGCPLIAEPYTRQLESKRLRVIHALARHPSLANVPVERTAAAEPFVGYRTRAKLVVGPSSPRGNEPAALGLFGKGGGHQVVDIPGCRVLAPSLVPVAAWLRESVRAAEGTGSPWGPFADAGSGALRAVDLREVEDGAANVLVTFVVQRDRVDAAGHEVLAEHARALMRACPEVLGVAANFHEGDAPQVLGAATTLLAGVASASDRIGNSVHLATFGSFVQAHRGQARFIHASLERALTQRGQAGSPPHVLDLYGGSGSIALTLAAAGARVALVESFAPAAEHAKTAADAQGLAISVECADAARALERMAARGDRFDAAVVNPPRRGTSAVAREALARLAPAVVAYLSCDPDTLARDLAHLERLGYAPDPLQPIDMIPLTDEVETLVFLRRAREPSPRVLFEDGDLLMVEKPAHEPSERAPASGSSLLARVRRMPGASAAEVLVGLDADASGIVVVARHRRDVALWQRVFGSPETRTAYLVAVRGAPRAKGVIGGIDVGDGAGTAARTQYRRLAVAGGHALVRATCEPSTPKVLRRHLAFVGHPILGDDLHGHAPTNRYFEEKAGLDRAFLHRHTIEFTHPSTAERVTVVSRLAGDLRGVVERMGGAARAWLDRADP
jgi:23S rRNA (uracil1939-C5)-methyltransferase